MNTAKEHDELLEQLLSPECPIVEQDFINSSMLKEASYDKISQTLTVKFKSSLDAVYVFYDVPLSVVQELYQAKSSGQFFSEKIKRGQYAFTKLVTKKKETK